MDHGPREHDLLRHARRIVRDHSAERVAEIEGTSEVSRTLLDDIGREPAQKPVVVEELAAGERSNVRSRSGSTPIIRFAACGCTA